MIVISHTRNFVGVRFWWAFSDISDGRILVERAAGNKPKLAGAPAATANLREQIRLLICGQVSSIAQLGVALNTVEPGPRSPPIRVS
jgi:hypothetical protein